MKLIARVEQVLQSGIHTATIPKQDGTLITQGMPLPDYVEIDAGPQDAMLYRYRDDGTFCGDSWHENLQAAKAQAYYEYGIPDLAWRVIE
jgi:hypothetical protein